MVERVGGSSNVERNCFTSHPLLLLSSLSIYINTHTRHTEKRKKIGFFFSHLLGLHVKAKWLLTDTRHGWNFFSCPTQTQKEKGENGFCAVLCFLSVWHGLCRLVAKDMSVGWGGRTGSVAEECGSPFHVICRVKLNGLPFLLFFPSQTSSCCGSH